MKQFLFRTAYFPAVMLALACIPGLNLLLFSLHGGLGWLLMLVCGPFTICRLVFAVFFKKGERLNYKYGLIYLAGYLAVTFGWGLFATHMVGSGLGVTFLGNYVWGMLNVPWSMAFPRECFSIR